MSSSSSSSTPSIELRKTFEKSLPPYISLVSTKIIPTMVYYAPIGSDKFQYIDIGYLTLLLDRKYHTYYIRLYTENFSILLLECELYKEIVNKIMFLTTTFLSIEVDNGILGVAFQNQDNCETVYRDINNYLSISNISNTTTNNSSPNLLSSNPNTSNSSITNITGPLSNTEYQSTLTTNTNNNPTSLHTEKLQHPLHTKKGFWSNLRFGRRSHSTSPDTNIHKIDENATKHSPNTYVVGDIIPGSFKHENHIGFNNISISSLSSTSLPLSTLPLSKNVTSSIPIDTLLQSLPKDIKDGLKKIGIKKKDIIKDPILYQSVIAITKQYHPSSIPGVESIAKKNVVTKDTSKASTYDISSPIGRNKFVAPSSTPLSLPLKGNMDTSYNTKTASSTTETSTKPAIPLPHVSPSGPPPPLPIRRRASLTSTPEAIAKVTTTTSNRLPTSESTSSNTVPSVSIKPLSIDKPQNFSNLHPDKVTSVPISSSINPVSIPPSSTVVSKLRDTPVQSKTISFLQDIQNFKKSNLRTAIEPSLTKSAIDSDTIQNSHDSSDMMMKLKQVVQTRRSIMKHNSNNDTSSDDDDSDW